MSSSGVVKAKPSSSKPAVPAKGSSILAAKKMGSLSKQPIADFRGKSVQKSAKFEVKPSSSLKSSVKTTTTSVKTTKTTVKRLKKVYSLVGQKFDPPEEREPLRLFYESLSKQIPSSEMAEFWLMEHGLLSAEKSKRAYEKRQRKQKQLRSGTPMKPSPKPYRAESSGRQQPPSKSVEMKAKKRMPVDSDDDDDFILSSKRRRV